jgi:hypothetical protein
MTPQSSDVGIEQSDHSTLSMTDAKIAPVSHAVESQVSTMTITRALAELKLLDKRITKLTSESRFMTTTSKKDQAFNEKTFVASSKAHLQAILDQVERRNKIKRAIIHQNAQTVVKVGGKQYTVAEAIDMKASLPYVKNLLDRVRAERLTAQSTADMANAQMEERLQNLLLSALGSAAKTGTQDPTAAASIAQPFREVNVTRVVDPINAEQLIAKLEAMVDQTESELDFTLSESNAVTHITI